MQALHYRGTLGELFSLMLFLLLLGLSVNLVVGKKHHGAPFTRDPILIHQGSSLLDLSLSLSLSLPVSEQHLC